MVIKKSAIKSLSIKDQDLFEKYGLGPKQQPRHRYIHKAIEKMAKKYPDTIAAKHLHQSITYKELNNRANALANQLITNGVKPNDNVGLFAERSIPMLIGLLATLKVGAAYVPQDARITPTSQLLHIIKSSHTKIILTLTHLKQRVPIPAGHQCITIDDFQKSSATMQPVPLNSSENCFILYTSGTTGLPNGVQVTHKNVCNIILTSPGNLNISHGDKVSQILNISFDMASWEILSCLSHGATLIIRGKSIQKAVEQANIVIATPSILESLSTAKLKNIKTAAVAGEPCPKPLAEEWSKFCRFYNSCGPTETTIVNTMKLYDPFKGELNIGKPTPNNSVYILDENLQPCPIGQVGEMWAGGHCVSGGYIKNKKLTNERYKPDPFLGGNNIMFRTRDLGRWNSKGEIEHFGRTDDQVKIKGFRVELDSVSGAIESIHQCRQAVTLKLDSRNLVSFMTPSTITHQEVTQAVEKLLPYYCMPSLVIPIDELPKTPRGKIDKKALTILAVKIQDQKIKEAI